MRDTLNTKEYFDEYIGEESRRVAKFEVKIASGTLSPERILPVKRKLCSIRINLLIAKYSNGAEIDEFKQEFLSIIDTIDDVWNAESYDDNLRLLSLCVLFNVSGEVINQISAFIKEKGEFDSIIECLSSNTVQSNAILQYPDVYEDMWNMICGKDISGIRDYLQNNWYQKHNYSYWFDTHKSKEKLYFGYWAFEIAALLKVLRIDATSLKGIKYFPYDLYSY